jgi:methionine-S-sulfoxide reductase
MIYKENFKYPQEILFSKVSKLIFFCAIFCLFLNPVIQSSYVFAAEAKSSSKSSKKKSSNFLKLKSSKKSKNNSNSGSKKSTQKNFQDKEERATKNQLSSQNQESKQKNQSNKFQEEPIEMKNSSDDKKHDLQVAILAGGCFWGMEEMMRGLAGVVKTEVGYTGGSIANPNYELVKSGISGHAEAVKITFDANQVSYQKLLKYFLAIHDPTQVNGQGNDIGNQYRSEIFYLDLNQKMVAENVLAEARKSGVFKKSLATKISGADQFFLAEEFHQNYLGKNPGGYTCHYFRKEWLL